MGVCENLKGKRQEIAGRIAALLAEVETLRGQVLAFDRVIAVYDPSARQARPRKIRQPNPQAQSLAVIGNKRQAVLEALRDAGRPLSTMECAEKVGEQHGIPHDDARMPLLANRLSAQLDALMKAGRVRQAGTIDGRRHLWEIAA